MIYIFRPQPSSGAVALAAKLTELGHPAKKVQEINRLRSSRIVAGQAKLVCWGGATNPAWRLPGLNNVPLQDKLQDAIHLRDANVPTIEFLTNKPREARTVITPRLFTVPGQENITREQLRSHIAWLTALATNEPDIATEEPTGEWLGRLRHHVGGNDLFRFEEAQRNGHGINVDFWVKKLPIVQEIRVHIFGEVSIRAGQKIPRAGVASPHPWIRSWDGGWMISYDGSAVRQAHRDLAKRAIQALGLTFGAVDLGITAEGNAIVLEVNRAPGLEGNSITTYANAIVRHFGG